MERAPPFIRKAAKVEPRPTEVRVQIPVGLPRFVGETEVPLLPPIGRPRLVGAPTAARRRAHQQKGLRSSEQEALDQRTQTVPV